MASVAAQWSVFAGYGAMSRTNGTTVPSAPSSTRMVSRAISSPVAVPRTDAISPRYPNVIVATSSSPPPQSPRALSHVERVVSSPAVCQQPPSLSSRGYPVSRLVSASTADVGYSGSFRAPTPLERGGSFRAPIPLDRGGYPISRLVSSSSAEGGGSYVAPQPREIEMGAPVAVAGIDTDCDGEVDYLYVGVDSNRVGIPDALQSSAKVNNLPTKTGSFTVPVLHAPSDVLASQPPGPLAAIVEGSGAPSAAMEAYLKSCFDWKRNPNNVFKLPPKASPRLESRPVSPPLMPRPAPIMARPSSPPVVKHTSAPAVVLVSPRLAPSPVVRAAPPPQSYLRSGTPPCMGRFEREAQKLIDALEGGLYSDLNTSSAGGTDDPQGYPSMLPSELSIAESTCSGQATIGGLSVGTASGLRPALRGEEVGIKRSLKAHAAKDLLDISAVEDIPELIFGAMASETTSQPSTYRGKNERGATIDSLAFSPRGSRDFDAEDRAGKIGYTNQFTAQHIFQASLKDGKKTEDGRKWVPPTKPRTATKESVQSLIEESVTEDREDDEYHLPRAEVEQKFQVSLRNHKPVKESKRSTTSRKSSSMSTWSNSSKSNSGSTLRDSTLSSLMKGGSGSFRASVASPRNRAISSGPAVKSRRNNTFDLSETPEKDSPLTAARKALEREALEKADDRRRTSRVSRMSSVS